MPAKTSLVGAELLVMLLLAARGLAAQSADELAARGAFLAAPTAALPPMTVRSGVGELALRYGGWKYYAVDPIRSNIGVSYIRRAPMGGTVIALTAGHLSAACVGCSRWLVGALDAEWRVPKFPNVRTTLGMGRALGTVASSASSIAVGIPLEAGFGPLSLAIHPGFLIAGVTTRNERSRGARPTLGANIGLRRGRVAVNLGVQGVLSRETAPVFGGGVTWALPATSGADPFSWTPR